MSTIAITEFLNNAEGPDDGLEFLELFNYGTSSVDLSGWSVSDEDVDSFTVPEGTTLASGEYLVLVGGSSSSSPTDIQAIFEAGWFDGQTQANVVGMPGIALGNSSDELIISDIDGTVVWSLAYPNGESSGRATFHTSTDLSDVANIYGSKAAPGVNRAGDDNGVLGFLGYEENDTATDPAATSGASGENFASPGAGNYIVVSDDIDGTPGNDTLTGTTDDDVINGFGGNDTLVGDEGDDILNGGEGDDALSGNEGNDTLNGGGGNDILGGIGGDDVMAGNAGNDFFIVNSDGDAVVEAENEGTDWVFTTASRTLDANVENIKLINGQGSIAGTGNELDNRLQGNESDNLLNGGDGNDLIEGLDGNDTLVGGAGFDALLGGGGNDTFRFDEVGDRVDRIIDFSSDDFIDLSNLFSTLEYMGSDPIADDYLKFSTSAGDTYIQVDADGTGTDSSLVNVARLQGFQGTLTVGQNVIVDSSAMAV